MEQQILFVVQYVNVTNVFAVIFTLERLRWEAGIFRLFNKAVKLQEWWYEVKCDGMTLRDTRDICSLVNIIIKLTYSSESYVWWTIVGLVGGGGWERMDLTSRGERFDKVWYFIYHTLVYFQNQARFYYVSFAFCIKIGNFCILR